MKIDVHTHLYPVAYLDLLDGFGGTGVGTEIARGLHADQTSDDLERRLAMMNKAGVDVQILSVSPQDPYFSSLDKSVEAARLANDILAGVVTQGRGRFAAFASLPLQLIQARVPERFPGIKFISSHLGGCLPFLMKRIDVQARVFMPGPALPSAEAKRFWYDTVNAHPAALRCACETFGADRLLLGTDTPYWQDGLYQLAVDYIRQSGLSTQDAERIYHENAMALFGAKLSRALTSSAA